MASTYTPLGIELQATGENAGTWGTKTNTNLQLIEQISGGFTQQSIAGGAQTTALSVSDGSTGAVMAHRMIEFTGTISGNQIVTIPNDAQNFYILRNSTSGSHTVQFKYASGSGATFTFSATDKGDKMVFAAANDGTNPDIKTLAIGTGISDVVDDTSPQLGGDLDLVTFDIVTTSNRDIELAPNGTGKTVLKGNTNPGTLVFNCEANTHGQTVKAQPHSAAVTNTLTLPADGDGELVSTVATQTLTNKTIDASQLSGTIANARLDQQLQDVAGLAVTNGNFIVGDGSNFVAESGATARTSLGLTIGSDVQAFNADTVFKDANNTFTAAQRGSTDTDTTNTGSVTLNFNTNQNFVLTLTGNVTLANPSTESVGQSGLIVFIQDSTGGRTVSLGTDYETAGGSGLTLSSAASTTDIVPYVVAASGRILLGAPQLAFA